MSLLSLAILLFFRGFTFSAAANCEVCVGFLHRLYGSLTSAHRELTPTLVEEELTLACAVTLGKEARLFLFAAFPGVAIQCCRMGRCTEACYYLGASSDAATRVTASVAQPLASHVPVEKICQRLSSRDMQICELRYEPKPKDLSSDGLKRLRVAELRNILASWGEECWGCLEKHEFISLIQEKAPLHAHRTEL